MTNPQYVNLLTLPIKGIHLIEASAGTGKTHTLVMLYLQLLLGLDNQSAEEHPLGVEEILVVTFTEAATEELRCRIRENIHRIRLACINGLRDDPILSQIKNHKMAALHLLIAEKQIDKAAIYTIHSFCQRILNQCSLECGLLFRHTLLDDERCLKQQIIQDFWRRHCYTLPVEIANIVLQYWDSPDKLLSDLNPYLQGEWPLLKNSNDTYTSIVQCHARIIKDISDLKAQWCMEVDRIRTIIKYHNLNHRLYSIKHISSWFLKINQWSEQPTINYYIPNELRYFKYSILKENTLSGEPPQHFLFQLIELFYQTKHSLRELVFALALKEIRQQLEHEKKQRAEIGFDDLLNYLDQVLTSDVHKELATSIRNRYPIAMIDEFQDTDPRQYRIFRQIYNSHSNGGLLLIGDPKQAIYAFRGADIFTYIKVRNEAKTHYTLDVNWRSSPGMIHAINQLFQLLPIPFIFDAIPFSPVMAAERNIKLRLMLQKQSPPALHIWLQPGTSIGFDEYKKYMSRQCAATINNWLNISKKGEAWLENHMGKRSLQASDIVVLVRNHNEAEIIHDALKALMIPAVYLSKRKSVFEKIEAQELLWILQGVLMPEKHNMLRRALATSLLGFDAVTIDSLNKNEKYWEQYTNKFIGYNLYWKRYGIFPMLRQIIKDFNIVHRLLAIDDGERRLTDVLHLSELIQEASIRIESKFAILRWLTLQIRSPNSEAENQQLRLEHDRHVVQIISIHKSKGLEFPIVFFPFPACFRPQKKPLFHDRQSYQILLDLKATPDSLRLAEEERLAEDLRLLYVAITRSTYHCSLGIAPLFRSNRRKNGCSDLHLSALGYLIQQAQSGNADYLRTQLVTLAKNSNGNITFNEDIVVLSKKILKSAKMLQLPLCAQDWPKKLNRSWNVISYTNLRQHTTSAVAYFSSQLHMKTVEAEESLNKQQLTPHTFPRGALFGTFLHSVLEKLDFTQPVNSQGLYHYFIQHGIDTIWIPTITNWITNVISIPLNGDLPSLSCLSNNNRQSELQFHLSIESEVNSRDLDQLCKNYDPLSTRCPSLTFPQIKGMLQGCIDLIFRWKDLYYLLDFKSNWLGKDSTSYTQLKMEQAMIINRYELQYQIYTLALDRFLRHRLIKYNYQSNFGGVFYLFLRGIDDIASPSNGIYYCRPKENLINKIDNLFTGTV
ncbi:exodeoxyribonuclease V subunit beta [Candidatus Curculioniphilus buchneri]|uniref:exodeoxyribonuclease V subunit beta n=1 Tax=Candidatus Curculioniphilus buchneri TaxID=690594 RepID=UPI00376F0EA7